MSLTQKDLIDTITNELGVHGTPISKTQVDAVLNRLSIVTARTLKAGGDVPLPSSASSRPASAQRAPAVIRALARPSPSRPRRWSS